MIRLGLALAGLALLGVACTSNSTLPASPGNGGGSQSPQPKLNRVVIGVEPPIRESNEIRHVGIRWQLRPMYEPLIGNDTKTGKPTPELAESWSLEPNGHAYRFKLRQGVKFHNNHGEFTARDVLPNYTEFIKDDSLAQGFQLTKSSIKSWDTANDHEIVLQMTSPNPEMIGAIQGMTIFSSEQFKSNGPATMQSGPLAGTGPYQYLDRTQASFVRFQRVPYDHWRVRPEFPEVEFRFMKEASTRLASLLTGELQLTELPTDLQREAVTKPGFKSIAGLVPLSRVLVQLHGVYYKDLNNLDAGMMYPTSPMADVRFRRALSKAVNRDELNKAFFEGKGKLSIRSQFNPTWPGWNPDWEKRYPDEYGYDPAKARALLAEMGFGADKPAKTAMLNLPVEGFPAGGDLAEAIAGYWRAIGVSVELQSIDSTQATAMYRQAAFDNHARIRQTAADQWTGMSSYDWGLKTTRSGGIAIPEGDKLLVDAHSTLDEQRIDTLLRQAGNIWYDQHTDVPLFWLAPEVVANGDVVAGYEFPGNVTGGWSHIENLRAVLR